MDKDKLEFINRRERQLLLHSALYYEFNKNIISDDIYDKWSFELKDLINNYSEEFEHSAEHECFLNFDPSSGYYLNYTNYINRAIHVYNYHCEINHINDRIEV